MLPNGEAALPIIITHARLVAFKKPAGPACYTDVRMTLEEIEREYSELRQQAQSVRSYL